MPIGGPEPPSRGAGKMVVRWLRGALVDNAALKFVALVLSLTVFILVHSDERAVSGGTVKVNYILPEDRVLVSEPVREVSITVEGSRRRLKRFHQTQLEPIDVDVRAMRSGEVFFRPSMIGGLPDGVNLVSITPASVTIELDERSSREVRVEVEPRGKPARGYRVQSIEVKPAVVTVGGAGSRLAEIESIPATGLNLEGRTESFRTDVQLVAPPGIEVQGEPAVTAQVTLGEEQGSQQLDLEVEIVPGPGTAPEQIERFTVEPERVRVVLRGSILAIEEVEVGELKAYVRLFPDDLTRGQPRKAEVRITPGRPGIGYEISPPEVTIRPRP
jgi:YbbR domain-containing protein